MVKDISIRKVTKNTELFPVSSKFNRDQFDPRAEYDKTKRICDFDLDTLADITNGKACVLVYRKIYEHYSALDINHVVLEEIVNSTECCYVKSVDTIRGSMSLK